MTRLLITGASGNLGRVTSALAEDHFEVWATYHTNPDVGGGEPVQLDLRDDDAVRHLVDAVRPDMIIHCAASERTPDMVISNRQAAQHIQEAAKRNASRLLALSTDLVFDGTQAPYQEDALPTPVSPYGKVKAENERLFLQYDRALVIRTSLIYDRDPTNNQIRWLKEQIDRGEIINLFEDEVRQPISAEDLSRALLELAEGPLTGLLHVAGPEKLNRWEFGCALLEYMGFDPATAARKALAADIAPNRPRDCTFDLNRMRQNLAIRIRPIKEVLKLATN